MSRSHYSRIVIGNLQGYQLIKRLILALALSSFSALACSRDFDEKGIAPVFIEAEIISKHRPKYPKTEESRGKEGWVLLSYVVAKDGSVLDPIVEDSSGNREFEKSAIRSIKKWKYTPASFNGKPTEQCHTQSKYTFKLQGGKPGASFAFVKRYKKIAKLIDDNQLEKANKEMAILDERDVNNLYEDAWLGWIKSRVSLKVGNKKETYENLLQAVAYEGVYLPEEIYAFALKELFVSHISYSRYAEALETFAKIEANTEDESSIALLRDYVQKIEQLINSDSSLVVTGTIEESEFWSYPLNRREFSYKDVIGDIDEFELRCDRKRQKFIFSDESEWSIPESWGSCSVYVYGKEGATFKLVEYAS